MTDFVASMKALLGLDAGDPAVEQFFQETAIEERPVLPKGDQRAYCSETAKGFSLIFTDQAALKNPKFKDKTKKGRLLFTGCHFYSHGHENYEQFPDALPCGLAFEDTRKEVVEKLGPSSWQAQQGGKVVRERWEHKDQQLNVAYREPSGTILTVYFGIQEFFTKDCERAF
jgi:hypothetical protein